MQSLEAAVDRAAEHTGFSGVVRVDLAGSTQPCTAYGLADRAHEIPNTPETLFAAASGTKTLTALAVMSLVERGTLELGTTARSLLGDDLPLVADDVTVEHLLAHRSGIGDYLDEHALDVHDYVMPVPVHELATTEQYLRVLDGHETVFPAGERFAYNNAGYVVLALLAERATGVEFHDLVRTLVCEPGGMVDTAFLRSDELPGRAALGYLFSDGLRSNVFHLPVRGSGDGGIYSTAADLDAFWKALSSPARRCVRRGRSSDCSATGSATEPYRGCCMSVRPATTRAAGRCPTRWSRSSQTGCQVVGSQASTDRGAPMPIWTVITLVILAVVVVMAIRERRRGLRGSADPQRTADRAAFETRAHLRGSQGPHGG